ncbi:phosphatidylinositol glycan anchor biosynthesis class G [Lycorma delicatula]|uniref:phosphatidylinositol glycan anchor biosynthesis class G n=1 Tax=Lycorma delicatula TaxID=130591 RepID=UPI003F51234D
MQESHTDRLIFIYCITVALLAVCLFLHGFFPVKSVKGSFSSVTDLPVQLGDHWLDVDKHYIPKIDKLVMIVIDAIRYDFIYGENGSSNMPYTDKLIKNNKCCLFKLKANAPTVTMPRIKAITSGSVSSFIDILMNFGSSEMLNDNIIDQAIHNKYKIVFYGDDTWLKLFPKRFNRSEGTSSFFVTDYTQVDNNVTRNVDEELKKDDWDIMILHYLGLDHIGHLYGPKSKLIEPKLNEMDGIIERIHKHLLNLEHTYNKSTLLIVLGDHGMADLGGHGGTSIPEIIIPLITYGLGCGGIYKSELAQVDVAPTLSVLLGIPLPADNVGQVITSLFLSNATSSAADIMYALYYNAYQVVTQFLQNGGTVLHDGYKVYWQAQLLHMEWLKSHSGNEPLSYDANIVNNITETYKHALQLMSSHLLKSTVDFDLLEMTVSIIILIQLLMIVLLGAKFEKMSIIRSRSVYLVLGFMVLVSFWFDLLNISCCISSILAMLITFTIIFIIMMNFILIANCSFSTVYNNIYPLKPNDVIGYVISAGTILQVFSTSATSLIEKEQQVWYHIFMLLLAIAVICSFTNTCYNKESVSSSSILCVLLKNKKRFLHWSLLMVIHRILRDYQNSVVHVLLSQDNKSYMSLLFVFGLIGVGWCCVDCSNELSSVNSGYVWMSEKALISVSLLIVYYYRGLINSVNLPFTVDKSSRGIEEVKLFFVLVIVLSLLKTYKVIRYISVFGSDKANIILLHIVKLFIEITLTSWFLICSLLLKPFNTWLMTSILLTCKYFDKQLNIKNSDAVYMTVYYWIGMVFYFYEGNSNDISSIDINAGYVGQSDYDAFTAGLLIAIHTFCFPILSYLLLMMKLFNWNWKINITTTYRVRCLLLLLQLSYYTVVITLHRYHLFIWSVFSPKLLYLFAHTTSIVFLYLFTETIIFTSKLITQYSCRFCYSVL